MQQQRNEPLSRILPSKAPLGMIIVAGLAALWLAWSLEFNSTIPFLRDRGVGHWIIYPMLTDLDSRQPVELVATYERAFDLADLPTAAFLEVTALRSATIRLNGTLVAGPTLPATWKSAQRIELTSKLQASRNVLSIDVSNDFGPPALSAVLEIDSKQIGTDESWQVTLAGAATVAARRASSPLVDPSHKEEFEPPISALSARWRALLVFMLLASLAVGAADLLVRHHRGDVAVLGLFALLVLGWTLLMWHNRQYLPSGYGFDASGHMEYVDYIQKNYRLPLAKDGWEMFQPPLYYVLAATTLEATGRNIETERGIEPLRFLGLAIGLIQLSALLGCIRILFQRRPELQLVALLMGGTLAAHLYIYQYFSNEGLLASLSTVAIWITLSLSHAEKPAFWVYLLLGTVLGLALLTKLTAVIPTVILLVILIGQSVGIPAPERRRHAAGVGCAILLILGIAGWHYARVWYELGTPFVANWDKESGFAWWQEPGFQTPQSLLRFGRVFSEPYLVGVHGIWEGVYSTLWGDGGMGGSTEIWNRPPWNYDFMSIGYLLSIVPTLLAGLGLLKTAYDFFRTPTADRGLLLGLFFGMLFAILQMNLKLPYYSLAKGFFGLFAVVSLCAFVATGFAMLTSRRSWIGYPLAIWLTTLGISAFASFWIDPVSPDTLRSLATVLIGKPSTVEQSTFFLHALLQKSPRDGHAWTLLAMNAAQRGHPQEAEAMLHQALAIDPNDVGAQVGLAILLAGRGDHQQALTLAQRAAALEPDYLSAWSFVGQLLRQKGSLKEATHAYREALRIKPNDGASHAALGLVYRDLKLPELSLLHMQYAVPLSADDFEVRIALAEAYAQRQEWDSAIRYAEGAYPLAQKAGAQGALATIAERLREYRSHLPISPPE